MSTGFGSRCSISLGFSHPRGLGQGSHVGPADGTRHGSPGGRSVRREGPVGSLDPGLIGMGYIGFIQVPY